MVPCGRALSPSRLPLIQLQAPQMLQHINPHWTFVVDFVICHFKLATKLTAYIIPSFCVTAPESAPPQRAREKCTGQKLRQKNMGKEGWLPIFFVSHSLCLDKEPVEKRKTDQFRRRLPSTKNCQKLRGSSYLFGNCQVLPSPST